MLGTIMEKTDFSDKGKQKKKQKMIIFDEFASNNYFYYYYSPYEWILWLGILYTRCSVYT